MSITTVVLDCSAAIINSVLRTLESIFYMPFCSTVSYDRVVLLYSGVSSMVENKCSLLRATRRLLEYCVFLCVCTLPLLNSILPGCFAVCTPWVLLLQAYLKTRRCSECLYEYASPCSCIRACVRPCVRTYAFIFVFRFVAPSIRRRCQVSFCVLV